MNYPDNNPKTAVGAKKVPLHLVPPVAKHYLALALEDGAKKYGPYNWRDAAISISVYKAAMERHMDAFWDGEDNAQDSGVHHIAHAMACCALILDALSIGKLHDDRPTHGASPQLQSKYMHKLPIPGANLPKSSIRDTGEFTQPPKCSLGVSESCVQESAKSKEHGRAPIVDGAHLMAAEPWRLADESGTAVSGQGYYALEGWFKRFAPDKKKLELQLLGNDAWILSWNAKPRSKYGGQQIGSVIDCVSFANGNHAPPESRHPMHAIALEMAEAEISQHANKGGITKAEYGYHVSWPGEVGN